MVFELHKKVGTVDFLLNNRSNIMPNDFAEKAFLRFIAERGHLPLLAHEVAIIIKDTKPKFRKGIEINEGGDALGAVYPNLLFESGTLVFFIYANNFMRNHNLNMKDLISTFMHETTHIVHYHFNNYLRGKYRKVNARGDKLYSRHAQIKAMLTYYADNTSLKNHEFKKLILGFMKMMNLFFEKTIIEGLAWYVKLSYLDEKYISNMPTVFAEAYSISKKFEGEINFIISGFESYKNCKNKKEVAELKYILNNSLKKLDAQIYSYAKIIGQAVIYSVLFNDKKKMSFDDIFKKSPFYIIHFYQKHWDKIEFINSINSKSEPRPIISLTNDSAILSYRKISKKLKKVIYEIGN